MTHVTGIPTVYRHTRFRSRLEARWAAFFDLIGWRWTYEPFDGNGYIPDFVIEGDRTFAVEIKPASTSNEFFAPTAKVCKGLDGVWSGGVVVLGMSPMGYLQPRRVGAWWRAHARDYADGNTVEPFEDMWWCRGELGLHALCGVHVDRVFGPDLRRLGSAAEECLDQDIEKLWSRAGNAVQWRPGP